MCDGAVSAWGAQPAVAAASLARGARTLRGSPPAMEPLLGYDLESDPARL